MTEPVNRTLGLSRKVLATVVAACGAQLVAVAVGLVATGKFDRVALAQLAGVVLTAVLGGVAGYHAPPDKQTKA